MNILVLKPSSLGDVVHTLPAVARVRRAFPQARLRWLVNPEWAPLLEGNPHLDETILFPRRELGGITRLGRQVGWLREMRARYRSELVLDFQGLLRSALIGRACRGGRFVGLSDAREGARFFYDRSADVSGIPHAVDRYLALAREAGAGGDGPLEWPLPEGNAPGRFDTPGYLLLHPFSRGAGKSLTPQEVTLFCRSLRCPVVIAGRAQTATGAFDAFDHVENWLNQTSLVELIWLIRHARFVVSVDSGPMHIAAALGRPLLSIHTWSDPARVGPYAPEAWILRDQLLFRQGGREARHRAAPDYAAVAAFVAEQMEA